MLLLSVNLILLQAVERRNRRYRVDQGGGLAWLLWQEGGVVVDVVDNRGIGNSLRVYQKEVTEGEHNK